jgi:hypothetical protein
MERSNKVIYVILKNALWNVSCCLITEQCVVLTMAKLKDMPGYSKIYTKKYIFTVVQSGLSTKPALDYRNHRIEICSITSDAYGRDYAIVQMPTFPIIVKKTKGSEQHDEAVIKEE